MNDTNENAGKNWTDAEVKRMLHLAASGATAESVAATLGRSVGAVTAKMMSYVENLKRWHDAVATFKELSK